MTPPHVIVVGGGLAGLACALALVDSGVRVTLLEARRRLGGRATSFTDQRSGEEIDNCQHVTMGCCTRYLALLSRLGVADCLAWHDEQYWIDPRPLAGPPRVTRSIMQPGALLRYGPALLSHATSFARARFLDVPSKLAIAQAALAIASCNRHDWRNATFDQWLAHHEQPEHAINRFWRPVVVSACNLEVREVCAATALHVFQDGAFAGPRNARIAVPTVPLARLYDQAHAQLTSAGSQMLLGHACEHLEARAARARAGEVTRTFHADAVVCALPFEKTRKVVCAELRTRDSRFAALNALTHSPILGVHLRFDRPVMDVPHAVLVDCPTQWLFRKDDAGTVVHAVISAADAWMDKTEAQIAEDVLADVRACFPDARQATLLRTRCVKERFATFAATPDCERTRVAQTPPEGSPGLFLAGDYTQTGWPATMEGAVRSGEYAALACVQHLRAHGRMMARHTRTKSQG